MRKAAAGAYGYAQPSSTCVGMQQHLAHAAVQIDVLGMLRS